MRSRWGPLLMFLLQLWRENDMVPVALTWVFPNAHYPQVSSLVDHSGSGLMRISAMSLWLACLSVGSAASADVLDFESLPETHVFTSFGAVAGAPVSRHGGFRFTCDNFSTTYPDIFEDVWAGVTVLNPSQVLVDGLPGYISGIRGSYALTTPSIFQQAFNPFFVEREDGGAFTFDGAWFTLVGGNTGSPLRIVGTRSGVTVFDIQQTIVAPSQTFVGGGLGGLEVDRLTLTCYVPSPNPYGFVTKPFIMDDFHFSMVPGPATVLPFAVAAVAHCRRRRQDYGTTA
jgi:hypothetical protein